jgi:hypothetical protein
VRYVRSHARSGHRDALQTPQSVRNRTDCNCCAQNKCLFTSPPKLNSRNVLLLTGGTRTQYMQAGNSYSHFSHWVTANAPELGKCAHSVDSSIVSFCLFA